jgi:hypothetical protein
MHYAAFRVAIVLLCATMQLLKLYLVVGMFLNEEQVRYLTSQFMPRLKESSVSAMISVVCHGFSILASAEKYGLTHQSLSKNLINLKELQSKIVNAQGLLSSSYLLKENVHALFMAEMSFSDTTKLSHKMCEKLGGRVESDSLGKEIKLYLDETLTTIYLNPDESYESEWGYDHCELK